jgi:protein-tyrosine phosphatase
MPRRRFRLPALIDEGRVVYLHCSEGINHAPSVALACLVRHEGRAVDAALAAVRACDAGARPYELVINWLRHGVRVG